MQLLIWKKKEAIATDSRYRFLLPLCLCKRTSCACAKSDIPTNSQHKNHKHPNKQYKKKNTRKNTMNMRIFRVMLAHCDSGLGFLLASQIIDVFVIYIHFPSPARNILFFDLCVDKDRLLSICRSSRYAFGWMRSPPGHLDHIENGKNCQLDECNLEPHTAHWMSSEKAIPFLFSNC